MFFQNISAYGSNEINFHYFCTLKIVFISFERLNQLKFNVASWKFFVQSFKKKKNSMKNEMSPIFMNISILIYL